MSSDVPVRIGNGLDRIRITARVPAGTKAIIKLSVALTD